MSALITLIDDWFTMNNGDGEFVKHPRHVPYSLIHPVATSRRVIYTTKPFTVLTAFDNSGFPADLCFVGRCGLPLQADLNWIRDLVSDRQLLFLGDMDPVDLMVFAWLRNCLGRRALRFIAVNDDSLRMLQIDQVDGFILKCSRSERDALQIVKQVLPDLQMTVGPQCASLLEQGRKIELDALVGATVSPAAAIRPLFDLSGDG